MRPVPQSAIAVYRRSTPHRDDGGVRSLRCDCGFEASGERDDELMSAAQDHARSVHDMELPAELLPDIRWALERDLAT